MKQVTSAYKILVRKVKNDIVGKRRLNLDTRVIIKFLVVKLETGFSWLSTACSGGLL